MKVVALIGSPRKRSNSGFIARHFCARTKDFLADVHVYELGRMSFRGCQGCGECKVADEGSCTLRDDLTETLQSIVDANIVVLATPVYFGDVSSQMKAFIDRTFSYLKPDFKDRPDPCRLPPGKKLVFVQSQAEEDRAKYTDIFKRYEYHYKCFGFECHLIRALGANAPGEYLFREKVLEQTENLAADLSDKLL